LREFRFRCLPREARDTPFIWYAAQTEARYSSRLDGPICGRQILNFVKVPVSGNEDHPVTFRRGGNPEVVLGKRPPLLLQALLQTSVLASNIEIA
jgi:hypothetical protein